MKATLGAFALGLVLALPAAATTISGFGSPATAVPGGTTETFETTAAGLYNALTFGNVTITGVDAPFNIGSDFAGQFNTTGRQSLFNDFDYTPLSLRFDFATAVQAFAFNWGAADFNWTLSAYNAANTLLDSFILTPTGGSNAGEFFGIAAANISYATLISTDGIGDYVFIDNFTSTAQVAPIPLPAGLPLLLGALGGLAALRRRRRG